MEQEERECEKCGHAHKAAEWHLRQVRDITTKQIKAQYLCGEAYRHLSSLAQARWTLRDAPEG